MAKNKLLVLLIEDDPIFQTLLEKKIRSIIDCHVNICATVDLAQNNFSLGPDLIIADHMLPDGTSFDILDLVKKEGVQVPVIVLSEQPEIGVAVSLMERGAHTYIEKADLKLEKLEKAITELTPYFTLKSDLKNASSMLLGGRQLFVLGLIVVFIVCIIFMFNDQ